MKYTILFSLLLSTLLITSPVSTSNVVSVHGMLKALNAIRANPKHYAGRIKTLLLDHMNADGVHGPWRLRFWEKQASVKEAIAYLNNASPLPALTLEEGITRAAYEHSKYQITVAKAMTHAGPGGQGVMARIKKYSGIPYGGYSRENIVDANSKWWSTPELVVLAWIIDDGVSSRGHRKNCFCTDCKFAGFGLYPHENSHSKKDRVTLLLAPSGMKTCKAIGKCPFSASMRRTMCYDTAAAGQDKCN